MKNLRKTLEYGNLVLLSNPKNLHFVRQILFIYLFKIENGGFDMVIGFSMLASLTQSSTYSTILFSIRTWVLVHVRLVYSCYINIVAL